MNRKKNAVVIAAAVFTALFAFAAGGLKKCSAAYFSVSEAESASKAFDASEDISEDTATGNRTADCPASADINVSITDENRHDLSRKEGRVPESDAKTWTAYENSKNESETMQTDFSEYAETSAEDASKELEEVTSKVIITTKASEKETFSSGKTTESHAGKTTASNESSSANDREPVAKKESEQSKEIETSKEKETEGRHTHAWMAVTKTVHHKAEYEKVWVEDKPAWDEEVQVKAAWDEEIKEYHPFCPVCDMDLGKENFPDSDDALAHLIDEHNIFRWIDKPVVVEIIHHEAEYKTVHHEAEGHFEKRLIKAAWDEEVVTGYKCSGCGTTK